MSSLPNACMSNFTFQDNVTTIGTGKELGIISGMSSMNLQFISSGTFTAQIEAQLIDTNTWYVYPSFKLPTYDLMSSTITDKSSLYNVDLTGITKIRVNLTVVGSPISVYAKVVS